MVSGSRYACPERGSMVAEWIPGCALLARKEEAYDIYIKVLLAVSEREMYVYMKIPSFRP